MKKALIIAACVAVVVSGAAVWLHAATPTVGALTANPSSGLINTPTSVMFTVTITDPSLLPNGVNLLQTDPNGKTVVTIGVMHDDGNNGDAVAGDKTFSYQVVVSPSTPVVVYYRASAAFRGVLQRVVSNVVTVSIQLPSVHFVPDSLNE